MPSYLQAAIDNPGWFLEEFWLILSGALHNFNMYALSAFQMPFLMRYHGVSLTNAGRLSTVLALAGIPGLLLGGFAGDLVRRLRSNGRLLVAALALLLSTPFTYLALDAGPGILYRLHLDLASLSIAEFYPDGASSVRLVNQTGYLS